MTNPNQTLVKRKKVSSAVVKVMANTLQAMKRHLTRDLTMSAKQLKAALSALETIFIRSIYRLCTKNLSLSTRKIVAKPLLRQAMKDKWLALAHQYRNGVGGGGGSAL